MNYDRTQFSCRSEAYEASEDIGTNPSANSEFRDVLAARLSRRNLLAGLGATATLAALATPAATLLGRAAHAAAMNFGFAEIAHGVDETHHVAPGYSAEVLLRWGDPVLPDAPAFDPMKQTAAAQARQFGYNCDFIGYAPLPMGSNAADHALLCVNHEYTSEEVMFPGLGGEQDAKGVEFARMTPELVDIEIAAHGASIVEIRKVGGNWQPVAGSTLNRRVTGATAMAIAGPAAGHARMKTKADPTGRQVLGMLNNCAGGMTPWGTYLTAEENFHGYFWGKLADGDAQAASFKRYGLPGNWYAWGKWHDRFDVTKEPNEANRFGWIVEIDPYDPASVPVKRTALGRFKHEGAETVVNNDGRVVLYSGDDERGEYLYKFVTEGRFNPADRNANRDLLDRGTLYVARFDADGSLHWLPLVFGQGPLTAANGFAGQGDVVIDTRRAADLLGATKMDRPEDVDPNPKTGKVYLMLTNNTSRKAGQEDAANPRADNVYGHIVEIVTPGMDHTATVAKWNILIQCGDPKDPDHKAKWGPETTENGWFGSPDNCTVDGAGRLWVSTDQGGAWPKSGTADGVWAVETEGPARGSSRMFFRVPVGAEMCGPKFAPDDRTLFVAVQHPATDGVKAYKPFGRESTFEDPATRWPDFKPGMPPRPSVVAITKNDGGTIGS